MLLDDIISPATNSKVSVTDLLRRCVILAHQLKNERLKAWANQELNGYPSVEGLPPYRVIPAGAVGSFSGPAGMFIGRRAIPAAVLEKEHRVYAETVHLTQAISAYEHAIAPIPKDKDTDRVVIHWDNNLVLRYQEGLIQGFALVSAWQEIPKSALIEVVDTVRNRVLNMALEIQAEVGETDADLKRITPNLQEAKKRPNHHQQHLRWERVSRHGRVKHERDHHSRAEHRGGRLGPPG